VRTGDRVPEMTLVGSHVGLDGAPDQRVFRGVVGILHLLGERVDDLLEVGFLCIEFDEHVVLAGLVADAGEALGELRERGFFLGRDLEDFFEDIMDRGLQAHRVVHVHAALERDLRDLSGLCKCCEASSK